MAYFRNATVNLLNLHYAIFAFVMTGGGAFTCVYLLKAGVPLRGVLVTMASVLLARFVIRPMIVRLAVRYGLRTLVIVGTILMSAQFPLIAAVNGVGPALYAAIAVMAIADTVYWSCYHAYFAALGDKEHRGHQISVREAIAAIIGIISPLVTGSLLVTFGAWAAFGAASVITLTAAIPFFWTPQVEVAPQVEGAFKAAIPGIKLFVTDGWIGSGWVFVWQMALFVSLGQSFVNYGGALAIAALVGAIAGLFLGRHIDAGGGGRAVLIALGAMTLVVLARAASPGQPLLAVAANAFASVGSCLYIPTLMTAVYNQAKLSPCTLRFHVATEGGWDIGGASGSLVAAALLWLGVPISVALLLPLIGIAASFIQLRRYYAEHPAITELEHVDLIGGTPATER